MGFCRVESFEEWLIILIEPDDGSALSVDNPNQVFCMFK